MPDKELRLLKLNIGDTISFNDQKCVIVDKTDHLIAVQITHHYMVVGDAYSIAWIKPEWVKTKEGDE